ncbi:hypothetical protein ACQEUV_09460 [Micromonospora aurantiaca (nom. illeg.)]|uniref:hypothetical protein n=1 Tax=Micromonospora aurantiaca (nom. illeg.) TaxID=47850 RepID=UPI003DA4C4D2
MSARSADARHVVVVGAGRLARSLCHALAATPTPAPLRVTVLARDPDAAHALARAARVRATVAGTPVAVTARPFTAEPGVGPGSGTPPTPPRWPGSGPTCWSAPRPRSRRTSGRRRRRPGRT